MTPLVLAAILIGRWFSAVTTTATSGTNTAAANANLHALMRPMRSVVTKAMGMRSTMVRCGLLQGVKREREVSR